MKLWIAPARPLPTALSECESARIPSCRNRRRRGRGRPRGRRRGGSSGRRSDGNDGGSRRHGDWRRSGRRGRRARRQGDRRNDRPGGRRRLLAGQLFEPAVRHERRQLTTTTAPPIATASIATDATATARSTRWNRNLRREWQSAKGSSRLTWENARHATRDSWQRVSDAVERAVPGDSDHDGK